MIKILIGGITVAMIGLVAIQLYWIQNAIALREQRFERAVNEALVQVSEQMERKVVIEGMKGHPSGRAILQSLPALKGNGRAKGKAGSSPSLSGRERSLAMMREMFHRLMRRDRARPFHERVNAEVLDSVIGQELKGRGIRAEYAFGVFDAFGTPKLLKARDRSGERALGSPAFMARLFPGKLFSTPYFLKVSFPNKRSYLIGTMWGMLSVSAVLILVVILAFSYTIFTILRQKRLSEIKNDLIGNMTHELKTPISTISLACEALRDPSVAADEQQKKNFVSMIGEENKRLGVLVENVLRSAVIDEGRVTLEREELDLHELIGEVEAQMRIQVEKKGGRLSARLDAKDSRIMGDRTHLTNVLYNLLENALKYGGETPVIEIRTEEKQGCVRVEVSDDGIGIGKADQKKVFERLYRVPQGNVHNAKGSGLGLHYVKVIVEKHGGRVGVRSSSGKGSTFWFDMPFGDREGRRE